MMLGNSFDNPPCKPSLDQTSDQTGQVCRGHHATASQQETSEGKSRRAGDAVRGLQTEPRREKSVRLTGRDKPCRQPARAAHPPLAPPALSRASWFAVGATLHKSGAPCSRFLGPFLESPWSRREQTFGCESLVNPVIKPRT